jgi:plasmid stability protein
MPAVQIKDVPDDVHEVLRRRARAAGQSLQEYLRGTLIAQARQPTLREIFDEVERDPEPSSAPLEATTAFVRAVRDQP